MKGMGHEIITGTTGMGKSFLMLFKIIMKLLRGEPCCVIDPKGDTYRNLLAWFCTDTGRKVWEANRHRIRLMNTVAKCGYVYGCNAIERLNQFKLNTIDPVALVASSLTSHIKRQSGFDVGQAQRMQEIMESAVGLLVSEGLALTELPLLFIQTYSGTGKGRKVDPVNPMVKAILPKVNHFGTKMFWEDIYPNWEATSRRQLPESTQNKIFQYLFNERILYHLNVASGFDPVETLEERQWLFVNIPTEMIGEDLAAIMGNLIISKLFHAAMQRPPGGPEYRLIIDEGRVFNTGPLDLIFERARAYNLWLTVAVQSLNQMCRTGSGGIDYHLKETAVNNSRFISVFGSADQDDTLMLSRLMFPITGTREVGQTPNGTVQYLPPTAEEQQYRQRIVTLPKRGVVVYDRENPKPRLSWTPTVEIPEVDESQIEMLEAEHLMLTGVSTKEAREEIDTRRGYWKDVLSQSQPPAKPKAAKPFEERL